MRMKTSEDNNNKTPVKPGVLLLLVPIERPVLSEILELLVVKGDDFFRLAAGFTSGLLLAY